MSGILIAANQSGIISKLLYSLKQTLSLNPGKFKAVYTTNCSSSDTKKKTKKTFNTPYPPKDPPENYNPECVNHKGFEAPDFLPAAIFRPFTSECEVLGSGADKEGCYKNAEYFAYHRFSFVALQLATLKIKQERENCGDERVLYEKEQNANEKCDA